jgi:glucose/arabinose dehydrogenase
MRALKSTAVRLGALVLAVQAAAYSAVAVAQQEVEFRGAIPLAPTGLAGQPLGEGPWTYKTGEDMDVRVEVVVRGIEYPMSMAFLPGDAGLLLVSRPGKIHLVKNGTATEIAGGPPSVYFGISGEPAVAHGYIDIALHPDFATNQLVYLAYSKPAGPDNARSLAVGRGRWTGSALQGFEDIWGGTDPQVAGAARIAFGTDKTLYIATSGPDPQDLNTFGGKVLRINDDGSIPRDNPFVNTPNAKPEVFTYGHRSSLGLAVHSTGTVWQNENGPNGGDEINLIVPGANYGWPLVSLGRNYSGPWQSEGPNHVGYQPPIVYWTPAIAVSGMMFYSGDALPKWKGDIFVGSLRTGEIPGTGHVERVLLNNNFEELRREALFTDLRQRIRDVRQGNDGFIYLATEERDGAILRIVPAE